MQLTISDLHLEQSDGCHYDSLRVYVDNVFLANLCGQQNENMTYNAVKNITVQFQTDGSNQYRGFRASYKNGNIFISWKFFR